MRKSPNIKPELMLKIWKLHEKKIGVGLIAETLGIHANSVSRIIKIMSTAESGGDVDSLYADQYKNTKLFAKSHFGIESKAQEIPKAKKETPTVDDGDFREFAVRVLFELHRLNISLEKICEELGVGNDNK